MASESMTRWRHGSERARAIGLFRYQLIREPADPGLSSRPAGRLVREIAARRAHSTRPGAASGSPATRWTGGSGRGAAAGSTRWCPPAPVQPAAAGRGDRDGGRAQAGEPGPHRGAGAADPARPDGVGARGADPATPLRRRPADRRDARRARRRRPGARRCSAGSRPTGPNELWTGDALHGPHDRRPQDLPVRVPRRPLPGDRRAPVRVRRGHRAPGRRAAPGARLARGPGRDLCRQRLGVRRRLAAAGLRQARDPADPLHPGPPAGPREDRAVLPDRPRAVPRRDHRRPRRRPEPAPGRRPGRAQPAVHRLGRDRLPPPRPLRDRAAAAGPLARRRPVPAAHPGRAGRGVPLGSTPHGHQDRAGVVAGQHLPGRPAAGRAPGRAGVRPVRPHHHRGPAPRRPGRAPRSRTGSGATPTSRPDPRPHPSRPRRPGSTTPA